mmetsp:Transcript_7625/g.15912  ORF Transcript_7625/g.15912 Transcript_7625/m.15912 type:complete len:257 (-) Transcript_7625:777-1547(-)
MVPRMGTGAQREGAVVGQAHCLFIAVPPYTEDGKDGPEGLFLGDEHVLGDVCEHGGFEELPCRELLVPAAANQDPGALRHGIIDEALVAFQAWRMDTCPAIDKIAAEWGRLAHGLHNGRHMLAECVVDFLIDNEAFRSSTILAHVLEGATDDKLSQRFGLGIVADDEGILAAELQDHRRESARGGLHDFAPDSHTAHKNDLVRLSHQRGTRLRISRDDLYEIRRSAHRPQATLDHTPVIAGGPRRKFRGLDDDRVA